MSNEYNTKDADLNNASKVTPQSTPSVFDGNIKKAGLTLSPTDMLPEPVQARELGLCMKKIEGPSAEIKAMGSSLVSQNEVNKLINLVMKGEETKAKTLIKNHPEILLQKGTGKDPAGRTFENITAFQYALWALDWYMWEMMLPHMDTSKAREQYDALMIYGTEYGKQFDFNPLIEAIQTYIDKFDNWDKDQCRKHWGIEVGGAQRLLPMHVVQEYCRTDRSFDPCPNFSEGARGTRFTVQILSKSFERFFPNKEFTSSDWFSSELGWTRGGSEICYGGISRVGYITYPNFLDYVDYWLQGPITPTKADPKAIGELFGVRKEQIKKLGESLQVGNSISKLGS